MMILPDLHKKGSIFWGIANTALSYLGWNDKGIPFQNITDRRLVSLQALLPSYMERGFSQPCQELGLFLSTLTHFVSSLMYFRIQAIESRFLRNWEHFDDDAAQNLLKLIEVWITSVCDHHILLDSKCSIQIFYIGCYLVHYFKLNTYNVDFGLIPMIEGSLTAILKDKSYMLDRSISGEFVTQMHSSIVEYIFTGLPWEWEFPWEFP